MASSFLNRWSQRKLEQSSQVSSDTEQQGEQDNVALSGSSVDVDTLALEEVAPQAEQPVEADNDEPQSVASLLASEAESAVKKAALRKLFLSGEFSEVDRLNDYDHDYQSVKSLSSDVAATLRDWINEEPEAEQLSESSELEVDQNVDQRPDSLEVDNTPMDGADSEQTTESMGQNIPQGK